MQYKQMLYLTVSDAPAWQTAAGSLGIIFCWITLFQQLQLQQLIQQVSFAKTSGTITTGI